MRRATISITTVIGMRAFSEIWEVLSRASLQNCPRGPWLATAAFMGADFVTVFVARHALGI